MSHQEFQGYLLIAVVGPTASGKSALSLSLAARLQGEIIGFDSVQVYRGLDIGTGKLPPHSRRGIRHHLIGILDAAEDFTAGDFRIRAARVLDEIRARGRVPVLVGGTGLYLRALLLGVFDGPSRSEELRARLRQIAERRGREFVHRLLARLDAAAAARISPRDLQKIIRAVEVCLIAGSPLSELHALGRQPLEGFCCVKIGLNPDRNALYERINRRVEEMFATGLVDEVRTLLARPDAEQIKALGSLGYRQVAAALRGDYTLDEALRLTQVATRQYAKRQMTWFRREPDVIWLSGFGDEPGIQTAAMQQIEATLCVDRQRPIMSRAG